MSPNYNLLGLFPVPVIRIEFKDHYKYNFPEVQRKDNRPEGWKVSLHTSFPGIGDDDPIVSPLVRDSLKNDLIDSIAEVFLQLRIPTNIEIDQLWYNIYHEHQGQEPHRHLPMVGGTIPYWSGIYYNKNASPTKFIRDDNLYGLQIFPGYDKSELAYPLSSDYSPNVKDGDILLFPPYLRHSIRSLSHHRDQMRMTFSFNMGINL